MEGLAREILADTYGIDSDEFDDSQISDIIELFRIEVEERIRERKE